MLPLHWLAAGVSFFHSQDELHYKRATAFCHFQSRPQDRTLSHYARGWSTCELSFIDTIICVGTLPTLGVSHYNSSVLLPLQSTSTVLSESCVSVNLKF